MGTIGTPGSIGQSNRKLILNQLRENGSMSRADLSRRIGMSFPAVSSNVKFLLDNGYIVEAGAGKNSFGRKSTLLSFNASRGYVVGVELGRFKLRCMLADLLGNPLASRIVDHSSRPDRPGPKEMVTALVRDVIESEQLEREKILCFCIGVPGVVRNRRSFLAPFMDEFSEEEMERSLKTICPAAAVLVENSANLGVIGERWKGRGGAYSDLVYINYGVGLGAGLIIQNNLYRGMDGTAGEIGFMLVDPARIPASFSEVGMLEEAISRKAIEGFLSGEDSVGGIRDLVQAYRDGKFGAGDILKDTSRYFVMSLVNICALLNPQAVIISGGLGKAMGKLFFDDWKTVMANNLPFLPDVFLSELDDQEATFGAVGTALGRINDQPIVAMR